MPQTKPSSKAIARRPFPSEIARFTDMEDEDDIDDPDYSDNAFAAFWLDPETAAQLAVPGGQAAETLHVTIAFCDDGAQQSELVLANALVNVQNCCSWTGNFKGQVTGYGRFVASDGSDGKDVFVALVDIVDLEDFAEDIEDAMERAGMVIGTEHGFLPHITLAYLEPNAPNPVVQVPALDLNFTELTWKVGDRLTVVPLQQPGMGWEMYRENGVADLSRVAASGHQFRLFVEGGGASKRFALVNGELPNGGWIQVLPRPGVFSHPLWGDIAITPERNAEFVQNFNQHVYQEMIPVDAEHETKLGGAFGYVKELRLCADGSADARVELTERGKTIMAREGFQYVSPEWFEEWTQPESGQVFHNVLIGVAFTNNPFFKEKHGALRPILAASERLFWATATRGNDGAGPSFTFNELPGGQGASNMATEDKGAIKPTRTDDVGPISATELKAFRDYQRDAPEMLRRMTELETAVKTERETNEGLRKENTERKFREVAKGWIGDVNDHVQTLVDLATVHGEASEQVERYSKNARAMTEQAKSGGITELTKEHGADNLGDGLAAADAVAEALRQANEIVKADAKVDAGTALNRVFNNDPALYERYVKQTEIRK